MKKLLPQFEHRAQAVIPSHEFFIRLAHSGLLALLLIGISLLIGMLGYHSFEALSWIDAFLNASMLLGGDGAGECADHGCGQTFCRVLCLVLWLGGYSCCGADARASGPSNSSSLPYGRAQLTQPSNF